MAAYAQMKDGVCVNVVEIDPDNVEALSYKTGNVYVPHTAETEAARPKTAPQTYEMVVEAAQKETNPDVKAIAEAVAKIMEHLGIDQTEMAAEIAAEPVDEKKPWWKFW